MKETGSKIIAIHQPNYIPWLGYFYKIFQSDIFVFLDDAQYSNQGMHNYTYIKTSNGSFRLKYPVKQSLGNKIFEVSAKDELGWKEKHLSIIKDSYQKASFFDEVFAFYNEVIMQNYENIADLNIAFIRGFCEKLGIKTDFVKASDFIISKVSEEKIIAICNRLGAGIYYSGTGAKAYQKEENFRSVGIDLKYSIFSPFEYPQLWEGFQTNVTAMDYFMNCGYDWESVLKNQNMRNL